MEYKKESNRIDVQFLNYETDEIILNITNRNWMNIGELFTDTIINDMIMRELDGKKPPKKIMVLASVVANLE